MKHIRKFNENIERIKLFESFYEFESLKKSIDDILVDLGDIEWNISQHNTGSDIIRVDIGKEITDFYFDWGYEGENDSSLFNFEDIYEPIMTLLSFMRDKYPDMKVEYLMHVNNNPESDDWFEKFLEENDLESTTLEDVKKFTNISSFDIEFTI